MLLDPLQLTLHLALKCLKVFLTKRQQKTLPLDLFFIMDVVTFKYMALNMSEISKEEFFKLTFSLKAKLKLKTQTVASQKFSHNGSCLTKLEVKLGYIHHSTSFLNHLSTL